MTLSNHSAFCDRAVPCVAGQSCRVFFASACWIGFANKNAPARFVVITSRRDCDSIRYNETNYIRIEMVNIQSRKRIHYDLASFKGVVAFPYTKTYVSSCRFIDKIWHSPPRRKISFS